MVLGRHVIVEGRLPDGSLVVRSMTCRGLDALRANLHVSRARPRVLLTDAWGHVQPPVSEVEGVGQTVRVRVPRSIQ